VTVASAQTFPVERERRELSLALAAMRGRLALVALLFALAAAAWWISAVRMSGMGAGMTAGGSGAGAMHSHAMGSMGTRAMHGHAMGSMGTRAMHGHAMGSMGTRAMHGHAMGSMGGGAMAGNSGNELGTLGWFVVTWIVMMAAMMFPSLAPTVALYARITRQRGSDRALLFAGGYLLVWGIAGAAAYGLFEAGRSLFGRDLAFDRAGGVVAAAVVALAALYQFTPLKDACLARCRGPLGFILSCWREGRAGALEMGARHALWCLGCCWALMAALFALGIMSLAWMALVAGLIALEKTLPWRRVAMGGTSLVLVGLAGALLAEAL
jgi:predicted metal-binding membrane protein